MRENPDAFGKREFQIVIMVMPLEEGGNTIPIAGRDLNVAGMLEARRDKLARLRADAEAFLAQVDNPYMVGLLRARFIKGMNWQAVAMQVGGGKTENGVKSAVRRFLNKRSIHTCADAPVSIS